MSDEKQNSIHSSELVRGFRFPRSIWLSAKNIENAMDFMPDDDDVILASYPKTGRTWLQYIVLQIRSKGLLLPSVPDTNHKIVPQIEVTGIAAVNALDKPRFYKHHMSYDRVQKNGKSKCLYIYRNPEDVVVSYYYYTKNAMQNDKVDFNEFFEMFMKDNFDFGSYFQHVLSFYKHRGEKNLLMISYEKLQANRREEILRVAKFLDEEYYKCLLKDDELFDKILEHTSFDYMQKHLNYYNRPIIVDGVISQYSHKVNFFRKGVVGNGRSVLSEAQRQRLKAAAENVLKGTSIMEEWY